MQARTGFNPKSIGTIIRNLIIVIMTVMTSQKKGKRHFAPSLLSYLAYVNVPRWYVLVAGRIDDACSARARPARKIGIIFKTEENINSSPS